MKLKILLLLLVVACFSSCQKDGLLSEIKQSSANQATTNTPGIVNQGTTSTTTTPQYINLQLTGSGTSADATMIVFKSTASTAYLNSEDAIYFQGFGSVALSSLSSDNIPLAINVLPLPKTSLTINLNVVALTDGIYTLNTTALSGLPKIFEVWLMDGYKRDSLDFRANSSYAFNIYTSDVATYGAKRFSLVIRQNPALGIHLLDFTAAKAANGAQINWLVENEVDYTVFTVQRSNDSGNTYADLITTPSASAGTYNYLDKTPTSGTNQYRLKITDLNGAITYSKAVSLDY